MTAAWEPPRCRHGAILLGCPDDTCPDQNTYVVIQEAAHDLYADLCAERFRDAYGLPPSPEVAP